MIRVPRYSSNLSNARCHGECFVRRHIGAVRKYLFWRTTFQRIRRLVFAPLSQFEWIVLGSSVLRLQRWEPHHCHVHKQVKRRSIRLTARNGGNFSDRQKYLWPTLDTV